MQTKEFKRQENNPGALLNVDHSGLAAYKRQREAMRNINNFNERLNQVETTLDEIKQLLQKALHGNS